MTTLNHLAEMITVMRNEMRELQNKIVTLKPQPTIPVGPPPNGKNTVAIP